MMARKKKRRFTSKAQVGYMFAKHPKLAKKMAHRNISDSGRKISGSGVYRARKAGEVV